jgi:salicylate hydroxylase
MQQQPIQSVIIVGGGLGGLVLAQALKTVPIKLTVFERDASEEARGQGYHIGLNADGAKALTTLNHPELKGLLEEQKTAGFSVVTSNLRLLANLSNIGAWDSKDSSIRPGIVDRVRLREFLTHGIEENIQWNKKFVRYEETSDKVIAYFEDGTSVEADLLVAADGANSRVRAQRCPEMKYQDVNCSSAFSTIPLLKDKIPTIHSFAKDNMLRVFGPNGLSILLLEYKRLNGEEWLWWAMTYPTESNEPESEEAKKQYFSEKSKSFHPEVQWLIEQSPTIQMRMEYKSISPMDHNPLGKTTRVTLLGDSAHATTTHGGLGANTAFQDAIDLANAIKKEGNWSDNVHEYEEVLMKRGFNVINHSVRSTSLMHSTGWIKSTLKYVIFYTIGTILSVKRWFGY